MTISSDTGKTQNYARWGGKIRFSYKLGVFHCRSLGANHATHSGDSRYGR
jgi:hypothetical protein